MKLPTLALALTIVSQPNAADGPTHKAKMILIVASITNIVADFPLEIWTQV